MKENFIKILSNICFLDEAEITFDLSIADDLALSSIMLVELIATLEESLRVSLEKSMGDIIACETVGNLFELVLYKCREQQINL